MEKRQPVLSAHFRSLSSQNSNKVNQRSSVDILKTSSNHTSNGQPNFVINPVNNSMLYTQAPNKLPLLFTETNAPTTTCLSWTIQDISRNEILWSKNPDEVREMASLTKIMTFLASLEIIEQHRIDMENEYAVVPRDAAVIIGTVAGLRTGDQLKYIDLLYALMLPSGNDAALTLAYNLGHYLKRDVSPTFKQRDHSNNNNSAYLSLSIGSPRNRATNNSVCTSSVSKWLSNQPKVSSPVSQESKTTTDSDSAPESPPAPKPAIIQLPVIQVSSIIQNKSGINVSITEGKEYFNEIVNLFVKKMNQMAFRYNLKSTQFANPHGLAAKSNHSSCADLSKLGMIAYQKKLIRTVTSEKLHQAIIINCKGVEREAIWGNTNKLLSEQYFVGLKTGWTANAGPCLSVIYKRDEVEILITLLNCQTVDYRWTEATKLAEWAYGKITFANQSLVQNNRSFNERPLSEQKQRNKILYNERRPIRLIKVDENLSLVL